jgi:hypothetical protein
MKHSLSVYDAPADIEAARDITKRTLLAERIERHQPPCRVTWTVESLSPESVTVTAWPAKDPMRQTEGSSHPPGEGL